MKKHISATLLVLGLWGLSGCELDNNDSARNLKFDNASQFTVTVNSLANAFASFKLAPGENIKLDNIEFPDFTWTPKDKVQVSLQSSSRNVTFVNAPPQPKVEPPPPTVIIITNTPTPAPAP